MANKLWKITAKRNLGFSRSTGLFSDKRYEILKGMEVEVITQPHCIPTSAQITEAFNKKYGLDFSPNIISVSDFDRREM